jgi:pheromone shutdown-related protein TraB
MATRRIPRRYHIAGPACYETRVDLPASVKTLSRGDATIHVVGTAHVSQDSIDDVRATIEAVKPDVVAVELDAGRLDVLQKESAFRDLDIFKVVREGKTLYLLAHLALASYQRRIGKQLGVRPGAELVAAVQEARERNIPVELIDRDINVTLRRAWRNLGLWKRTMLLTSLVFGWGDDKKGKPVTKETVEELKEPKALSEMLTELGRAVPEVKEPLVDERDRYMASKLADTPGKTVVAVVGAAHVPGIKKTIESGETIDRAALETMPPPSLAWRIFKWAVPVALLGLLALVVWKTDASFGAAMLGWIIPTSALAGLFTLLSGGTLASIATAIVSAPVERIIPVVRVTIVVGIVEAWRRKPSVADCERLAEDTQTFRGFFRNRVTRVLVVAVASGLGTAIGFWVGVGYIATRL